MKVYVVFVQVVMQDFYLTGPVFAGVHKSVEAADESLRIIRERTPSQSSWYEEVDLYEGPAPFEYLNEIVMRERSNYIGG